MCCVLAAMWIEHSRFESWPGSLLYVVFLGKSHSASVRRGVQLDTSQINAGGRSNPG